MHMYLNVFILQGSMVGKERFGLKNDLNDEIFVETITWFQSAWRAGPNKKIIWVMEASVLSTYCFPKQAPIFVEQTLICKKASHKRT